MDVLYFFCIFYRSALANQNKRVKSQVLIFLSVDINESIRTHRP